jgi:prolyl-tRNA editing enzyme YbaK/EbsC (Cys-tRNA(Pro) deacylase)
MSIEIAREYLKGFGMDGRIMEFDISSATVELAARAVGTDPERICKTLSFKLKDGTGILVQVAGDARVDNRKYKDRFGCKATMIPGDRVEELVGHEIGGVCPFGVKEGVRIYLDEKLKLHEAVYPACGNDHSAVRLTTEELEQLCNPAEWIDVCKM